MPLKLHARQTKAWESTLQHAMLALYCTIKAGWRYFNLFSFVLYEYFLCYVFAECLNKTKAKNTQPRCVPDMFSPLYKFCSQKTKKTQLFFLLPLLTHSKKSTGKVNQSYLLPIDILLSQSLCLTQREWFDKGEKINKIN